MPVRPLRPDEYPQEPKPKVVAQAPHTLKLDPSGSASPTALSAINSVRHRIRDGVPTQDTTPVPFNMVRLESCSDQVPAVPTPTQTVFQVRFGDIPTQRYMNAQVVPNTLVAYIDDTWNAVHPTVDVDVNGNFTLPIAPVSSLRITYAWQYLSDGEINEFLDKARQWLREFTSIAQIPDGLAPAFISYASYLALLGLARSANLAPLKTGDTDVDWSKLAMMYEKLANDSHTQACKEREEWYTMGPEALDPTAASVTAPAIGPYTPIR